MTRCALYRVFNDRAELIYVGTSADPIHRLVYHKSKADWFAEAADFKTEWFDTREAAIDAEVAAIVAERPRYNASSSRSGPSPANSHTPPPGAALLTEWMASALMGTLDLSQMLDVPRFVLRQVMRGRRPPNETMARTLEDLTDGAVPASSWTPTA